jgi:hypothetical protein
MPVPSAVEESATAWCEARIREESLLSIDWFLKPASTRSSQNRGAFSLFFPQVRIRSDKSEGCICSAHVTALFMLRMFETGLELVA